MKKYLLPLALTALFVVSCKSEALSPADYVDPFIGTGFHGHTYPGATVPFGAVQLSPDNYRNVWDACSGYHHDRDSIIGFSHTHLSGTGCADLGDILFHPASHDVDLSREGDIYDHLKYAHADEKAFPGYYSVMFKDECLKAELTATLHTGWHRYTFHDGAPQYLVIDMHHVINEGGDKVREVEIMQTAPNEIRGMRITDGWTPKQYVFFVAQFSKDIESVRYVDDHRFVDSPDSCMSLDRQAVLNFKDDGTPVIAKVGISQVSYDKAEYNLSAEGGAFGFDFDAVCAGTQDGWKSFLDAITVQGGTESQKRTFYTALYHTAIVPNTTSDNGGYFRRNNNEISCAAFGTSYSTLSMWDTFRTWLPLASFIYPRQLHDMVFTCLDMYDATGSLPLWPLASGETECMIGYHSIPFIVDAWFKGLVPDLDTDHALEAMVISSNTNKKGSVFYKDMGYIPADKCRESVSCALEYAYDDWCIARFAENTGNMEVAAEYYGRAANFRNLYDGSTGFMRGRNMDGSFVEPFNPFKTSGEYTEANAWQYSFFAPHDFKGLSDLHWGEEKLAEALDGLFSASTEIEGNVSDMTGFIGQYVHGNEPSHHIAYIYNYVGQPWKTQELTRRLLDEMYKDTPDGISGNEDCGQMSAWYIMSALGLYEVCPGSSQFTFTSPVFEKATVRLPGGGQLVVTADNPSVNKYIKSVELNGKALDRCYVTYDELKDGGELHFTLVDKPCKDVFITPESRPYSMTE